MRFTYKSYINLIHLIRSNGYSLSGFNDWSEKEKCVILRHDIDFDLNKAVLMAQIESENAIKSTYFILVTSDFYNVLSSKSINMINKLCDLGHDIGLHFDETRYPNVSTPEQITDRILYEANLLSDLIGIDVNTVAMHRPGKKMLEADLIIPGMINTYSRMFFAEFKYLSDSRRCWKEPAEEIISSGEYDRLQILTHAFWYNDNEESIHDTVKSFINKANIDRYYMMSNGISDIDSIICKDEVLGC